MAKKSAIQQNMNRQKMVDRYRNRRQKLKAIAEDKTLPPDERFTARLKLAALPRNSAQVRIRNRCAITGRPRAYYRRFGISRIALRDMASQGQVCGVVKSSW